MLVVLFFMSESIQVVHIDDEPDLARLVATNLERENNRLSVQAATSVEQGLNQVGIEQSVLLVIINWATEPV